MTLKGTYNQGLSYYWVGFVDMIQFASDILDRLGKIINGRRIDCNQRADIKLWLEQARENTRYTREYLRHTLLSPCGIHDSEEAQNPMMSLATECPSLCPRLGADNDQHRSAH
jgi:hypothetical protein